MPLSRFFALENINTDNAFTITLLDYLRDVVYFTVKPAVLIRFFVMREMTENLCIRVNLRTSAEDRTTRNEHNKL